MVDVQKIIDSMSLEQKIGQMFIGNICAGETLDFAKQNFEKFHFGSLQFSGVFERFVRGGNYLPCGCHRNEPLDKVAEFLANIKKASVDIMGLPAIIGGDEEGSLNGNIFRRRNITIVPTQMGIGASGKSEDAYTAAKIQAHESKVLGLDMIYGPPLDVNTNPLNPEIGARSFSDDPQVVAEFGAQVIRAYADENIISTGKHFPGRGHGQANSHYELETIDVDRKHLEAIELIPFRKAIEVGVDSIMMGHTLFPALEKEKLPSSLSPNIIQKLLREEMGFEGVIIPDTLSMFAISKNFGIPQASAMCLEAGSDMIFMKVPEQYQPIVDAIKESVKAGRLTEERINQSLTRILNLKIKHGLFGKTEYYNKDVLSIIGCEEHVQAAREISRRAVVVLKNEDILPVSAEKYPCALAVVPRDLNVLLSNDPDILSHEMLPKSLRRYFQKVIQIITDEKPNTVQKYEVVSMAKNVDIIIFGIYSSGVSKEQIELLESLVEEVGKPIIVINTTAPYLVERLPEQVKAVICSFGLSTLSFEAAVDIMMGKVKPAGRLSVNINKKMKRGFCLDI